MLTDTRGLLMVFTGNGKGKTTAAIGMAVRAAGHEMRVLLIQMLKGTPSGELDYLKRDRLIEIHQLSQGYQLSPDSLTVDRELAKTVWSKAEEAILGGEHDLVILDDLNFVLSYDLIPLQDVLFALRRRPAHVHVVVTGRNAPDDLIEAADMVTVMDACKHPFMQGIAPQTGVEY